MLSIGAVARETGIQIATLRKWEARYGYPVPLRTEGGQRLYRQQDVDELLEIGRQIAAGERPGKIIAARHEWRVAGKSVDLPPVEVGGLVGRALEVLKTNDLRRFRELIEGARLSCRAEVFIEHLAAPLTTAIGDAWQRGELPVFAEHYFARFLREQLGRYCPPDRAERDEPMVLLANPSGEHHTLGLAMLDAALQAQGIETVMLDGDLPVGELVSAAVVYKVQVVALSASLAFPPKMLLTWLASLRRDMPATIPIWIGGMGSRKLSSLPPGVIGMSSIQEAVAACKLMLGESSPPSIQEPYRS
ncbi:MAG: MerR family transcriptional regulator [Azonexus sp.]|nr:MerR family transcriptional regulator [Azonexus sp.]